MGIKIISLNVNGIRNKIKRKAVFNYCKDRADIICLQETHSCSDTIEQWQTEIGGQLYTSYGTTDSRGMCIFVRKGTQIKIINSNSDNNGRRVSCLFEKDNKRIYITNIYAPNSDSLEFFEDVINDAVQTGEKFLIISDFNVTVDPDVDRKGKKCNNDRSALVLKNGIEEVLFVDVWRARNPGVKRWSYTRNKPNPTASRNDYALASIDLAQHTKSSFYIPNGLSDHSAFFVSCQLSEHPRGSGYWKLNNSHLSNIEFVQAVNQHLINKKHELQ